MIVTRVWHARATGQRSSHGIERCPALSRWAAQDDLIAIVNEDEAARNDYNLSPSRYISVDDGEPVLPLEEAVVLLAQAEEARAEADAALDEVLATLGFEGWREVRSY